MTDPTTERTAGRTTDRPARGGRWTGWRLGLAARLFLANGLVIVAGAGTLLIVALLFGPPVFLAHLERAGAPAISTAVRDHVEQAFAWALLIAVGVGVLVATGAAGAVSWLVARRLAAPVQDVVAAAEGLADGHPGEPVTDPGLGPEFASLVGSMNRLSGRLRDVEQTRRRLTADLAHQLRTPLASVRATAEAMADGVLPADPPTLAVLTEQTDRLLRLVADLEQVSRAEERQLVLHPAPQPLGPLVERCVATAGARYHAKGVVLQVVADPAAPRVRIDADRVAEALSNLLDNALRHTSVGGTVTVTVRPDPSARGVIVTVEDTGAGFDPDQAERLFERFHRGSGAEPSTGAGLGLTIARAIVESHGGRLTAASSGPGRGATFSLTLPETIG